MFAYRALVLCNTALFFSKGCRMKKQLSGLDCILCYLIISSTHPIAPWNICPFMYIVVSCCPGCGCSCSEDELGSRKRLRASMFQGTHSKWGYKPDSNPDKAGSKAHDTHN